MAKECPVCRLVNHDIAERCDCGYDFATQRIMAPYANPLAANRGSRAGMFWLLVGSGCSTFWLRASVSTSAAANCEAAARIG
jgi:hypothetical protein